MADAVEAGAPNALFGEHAQAICQALAVPHQARDKVGGPGAPRCAVRSAAGQGGARERASAGTGAPVQRCTARPC